MTGAGVASRLMPTYRRYPLTLVRGEGTRVWDADGRAYLDFAGGIAAMPLGHSHPAWVRAVTEQAGRLVHVSNLFGTEPQEALAARLSDLAGFGSVFLANSGAEANEGALKIARKHGRATGRTRIVTAEGSFHGRTFATLAATGQPAKQAPFEPLVPGFTHVPSNDPDALDAAVGRQTAAVLLEPVLGEGGVVPLSPEYLATARDLCTERGALLMFDEVQTGVGAKGLGGGLPIGAVVAREEVAFGPGEHASTFGGGPVPCAGALAVLDAIRDEDLLANCLERGAQMVDGLRATNGVGVVDVRGLGLLVGVAFERPVAGDVVRALIRRGFLATESGADVVRVTPPLSVGPEEVDAFVTAFPAAAEEAVMESAGRAAG